MTREEKLAILKGGAPAKPTREEALAILKTDAPAKAESNEGWGQWLKNIDMALGQGVVKGVVATPGLPGDIQQLLQAPRRETDLGNLMKSLPQLPTSGDTLGAYEQYEQPFRNYTGVPAAAERVGEFFTPTPGGKGKVARDIATSVLGAGGSLGGEALGEKLNLSPDWMSMLGGLLGVAGGQAKQPSAVTAAAKDAPSPEALMTTKDVDYDLAEAETNLDKKAFANTVSNISAEMQKKAVRGADEPELGKMLMEQLNNPQMDFVHLDSVAQRASAAAVSDNSKERKYGKLVQRHIASYYDELEKTRPGIKQKVADAKEQGRSVLLSEAVERRRSPSELAKMGEAIGEMDSVRSWAKENWHSLKPLEREAAVRATGRATAQMPLRTMGRFLQGAPARTAQVAATLAAPWTGGMEQAAIAMGSAGVGAGAERIADAMTSQRLDDLEAVLRSGKKGQAKAIEKTAPLKRQATESGLAGVLGAIRSEQAENYERRKRKAK